MPNDNPDWGLSAVQPLRQQGNVNPTAGTSLGTSLLLTPGFAGIGYIADLSGLNLLPTTVQVTGDQTQTPYLNDSPVSSGVHGAVLASDLDTSCTLTVTAPAGGPSKVWLLGLSGADMAIIAANAEGVIGVSFQGQGSGQNAQPAFWQAPQNSLHANIANGGFPATLVVGLSGQRIRVWGWNLELNNQAAQRFAGLRPSSAAVNDGFANAWLATSSANGYHGGIPLPAGDALMLDSNALNGEILRCGLGYSQG